MATIPQTFTWDDQEQKPPEQGGGFKWDDSSAPAQPAQAPRTLKADSSAGIIDMSKVPGATPGTPMPINAAGIQRPNLAPDTSNWRDEATRPEMHGTAGGAIEEAKLGVRNVARGAITPILHPIQTGAAMAEPIVASGMAPEGYPATGPTLNPETSRINEQTQLQAQRDMAAQGAQIKAHPAEAAEGMAGQALLGAALGKLGGGWEAFRNARAGQLRGTLRGVVNETNARAGALDAAIGNTKAGGQVYPSAPAPTPAPGAPTPAAAVPEEVAPTPTPAARALPSEQDILAGLREPATEPGQTIHAGPKPQLEQPRPLAPQTTHAEPPSQTPLLDALVERMSAEVKGQSPEEISALRDAVDAKGKQAHESGDAQGADAAASAHTALSSLLDQIVAEGRFGTESTRPAPLSPELQAAQDALTGKPIGKAGPSESGFAWDDQKPAAPTPDKVAAVIAAASGKKDDQRPVVQASTNPEQIQQSAEEQKPALKQMAQAAVQGVPGAKLEGARVKDAESVANKEDRGKPPETITDHLGARVSAPTPEAVQQVKQNIEQSLPIQGKDQIDSNGLNATQYAVQTGKPGDANQQSELQVVTTDQAKAMKDTDPLYDKQKEALARGDQKEADRLGAQIKEHFDAAKPDQPAPLPDVIPKGTRVQLQDGRTGTVQWYDRTKQVARVKRDDGKEIPMVPRKAMQAAPAPSAPAPTSSSSPSNEGAKQEVHPEAKGDKWIGVDLDGTLAQYDGFKGSTVIGEPIPAMVDRVKQWIAGGNNVKILTARVNDDKDGKTREAIQDWTEKHLGARLEVTDVKDPHMVALYDDRAVGVERNTGKVLSQPQPEDNHAQSGNGGQPSAATAPKGAGGETDAVQKPSAARVLQREPEQDRSEGGGRVQPEQQGNEPAGEGTAAGPGKEEAKPLGGAHGEQGSQGNAADEVKPKTFAEAVKAKKAKAAKPEEKSPEQAAIEQHRAAHVPGEFARLVTEHGQAADKLVRLLKDPTADPKELAEAAAKVDELAPRMEQETGDRGGPVYAADFGYKKPEEKEHKYKFGNTQTAIPPSSDAGKALAEVRKSIDPADLMGKGLEKDAHITVRYGIQGDDTAGIKAFIEQQAPFDATLGPVAKFPPSEHSDGAAPLIAPVESPDLHKLNAEIEKHGDFTEPSFPEYRPHATIAYAKPEAADKYVGDTTTEGATFRVDSIDITDRDGNAETVKLKGTAPLFSPGQPVRISGEGFQDARGNAIADDEGTIKKFTPAEENHGFNTAVIIRPDGNETRVSWAEGRESPLRAWEEGKAPPRKAAPSPAEKAKVRGELAELERKREEVRQQYEKVGYYSEGGKELSNQNVELTKQIFAKEDELAKLNGEPTRDERKAMQEQAATTPFDQRPAQAMKYDQPQQSQHWQVMEPDYANRRFESQVAQYERAVKSDAAEVENAKPGTKAYDKAKAALDWRRAILKRLKDRDDKLAQQYKHEYLELVKKAISKGSPVPDSVIAQYSEFRTALDARERYEKGRHTSFANRSAAINDTMQKEEGFKAKRQDGKAITDAQVKEIKDGIADIATVLGADLRDMMRGTDLTIAHTNGKHPFLSDAGGMYHPGEKSISAGIDNWLGQPVRALAHEVGHWFDYESGKVMGAETKIMRGGKRVATAYASEADADKLRYAGYGTRAESLYSQALKTMTDTREVTRMLKVTKLSDLDPEARSQVERTKVVLGHYWREPREIFARLFEQYISEKLGRGGLASETPELYHTTPGWWDKDAWTKLEPMVEAEVNKRLAAMRERYAPKAQEAAPAAASAPAAEPKPAAKPKDWAATVKAKKAAATPRAKVEVTPEGVTKQEGVEEKPVPKNAIQLEPPEAVPQKGKNFEGRYLQAALEPAKNKWDQLLTNAPEVGFSDPVTRNGKKEITARTNEENYQDRKVLTLRQHGDSWSIVYQDYSTPKGSKQPVEVHQVVVGGLTLRAAKEMAETRLQTGDLYDPAKPFYNGINREVGFEPDIERKMPDGLDAEKLVVQIPNDGRFTIPNNPAAIEGAIKKANNFVPEGPERVGTRPPKAPSEFDNAKYVQNLQRQIEEHETDLKHAQKNPSLHGQVAYHEEELKALRLNLEEAKNPPKASDLGTVYSGGFLDPALFKRLFPDIAERTAQWAGDTKTPGDDQRAMMRETRGQMDRRVAIAIFKLRGAAKEWRTRPRAESIDFWNAVENGRIGSLSPKDQALARVFKAAFDQMRGDLQKLKPEALQNYIENYFPHIWERSSQVTSTIKGMLTGKKPFAGKGGFLKRRTIPTMQDGLDLGFVPKSWNPVDLFVLKYAEMAQFLMGHQTLEVMKESGTAKFVRIGQKAPEGFTQLDDKIATVYRRVRVLDDDKLDDVTQPLTYPGGKRKIPGAFSEDIEDATHGELALVGHYYAPADAARVFNNFVSRGIAGRSSIYDTLRWLNDNLNGLQLGISAFHATVTTVNAAASDIALGIEQLMQGKPVEAGKSMVSGAAILPTLYRTIRNGSRLMREYLSPGSHAKMTKEADAIAEAGGRVKQNTIELKPFDKAINAFRNGAFFEGLSAVPGAILQGMVAPVLDYYVPRMKVGAFYYMAHNILDEAQRKNWTPELTRTRLQEAWDSIDDRFGQVVYDNLFWHKGLRDTLHLAVRAVGYTYGDIRTYGGAVKDTAKAAVQVGRGKKPRVTPRMAFAAGSFISTALLGGVMTMAWTGHAPQTWKDYTHPMDNTGQRHTIPGYPDQMISAGHDPIQWALNKQAPIWSLMAEAARNSDFNGTEIRHKDDPAIQQIAEVAEWAVKQPIPFSFSNTGKLLEDRGAMPTLGSMLHEAEEHPGDIALGNLGFTPAPSFIQHSEALSKAYTYERENRPAGTKTKEQAEKQQAMHSLRSMFASGKVDRQKIAALKAQGIVNERDLLKARLTAKTDPLVRVVKSLTPEQALNVWNAADAKERKELRSTIEEKSRDVYTKVGNPEKRRELQAKYREALRPTFQVRPGSA